MKKQSKVAGKKAPTDLLLPQPMELAKLAAMLAPNGSPAQALERAMGFYVEAVIFSQELRSSFDGLLHQYGSSERRRDALTSKLAEAWKKDFADALELNVQQDDDDVRRFLRERGLSLKTHRAVLDNIRRSWNALPGDAAPARESADDVIKRCARVNNGNTVYMIPRFLLEIVANSARRRRSESKRKAWKTRQNKSSV